MLTARAPAKLIISGEHAVVYGQPALAMAVNRYADTSIRSIATNELRFHFVNLKQLVSMSFTELSGLKSKVENTKTLANPAALLQYACAYFLEYLKIHITTGLEITVNSLIPVGCGMGSSAAVLVSLLHAIVNFFAVPLSLDKYVAVARQVENFQHGTSSGLDLFLSTHGGCYLWDQGAFMAQSLPRLPFILVNSGKPLTTTGECVTTAAPFFLNSSLADIFAEVTTAMHVALKDNNLIAVQQCMRENHRLLKHIGVVPPKVCEFIAEVEALGGAAKTSGAGAVKGDNAGIILVFGNKDVVTLAQKFGYAVMQVQGEVNGVAII